VWEVLKKRVFERESQKNTIKLKLGRKVLKVIFKKTRVKGLSNGDNRFHYGSIKMKKVNSSLNQN
jgi:hypothetical protein